MMVFTSNPQTLAVLITKAKVLTSCEALSELATVAFHISVRMCAHIHRYLHTYPHHLHLLPYFLVSLSWLSSWS